MRMRILTSPVLCFLTFALFGITHSACGEIRVLFLGNSYTGSNNLQAVVENIAASASPSIEVVADVQWSGGATLYDHKNSSLVHDLIANGNYDFVVLQDQSQRPWYNCPGTLTDATFLDGLITASGAKTVMFMTWGRQSGDPTTEPLAECYTSVATTLGAELAPVGLAWERSLSLNSSLTLHKLDGSHPNEHGTYLAACIFYSLFTASSPLGLSSGGLTEVSGSEAYYLQRVAWHFFEEVWVRFDHVGTEDGSSDNPFNTIEEGVDAIITAGTVRVFSGDTNETVSLSRPMTITGANGLVRIGVSTAPDAEARTAPIPSPWIRRPRKR